MSKLREDLRIGVLGAAAGLFSSSFTLLIARIDEYYAYLAALAESDYSPYRREADLWWIPLFAWHILLSVGVSLVVHRYLMRRLRSPFLLWQIIGTASLVGWGMTILLILSLVCVMEGDLDPFAQVANKTNWPFIAKYVSTIFACNVFYGSVMHASSRHYLEQFDRPQLDTTGNSAEICSIIHH